MSKRFFWPAAFLILVLCGGDRGPVFLRLGFLGDVMLGRGLAAAHAKGDWDQALLNLPEEVRKAHFTLANLESPLLDRPEEDAPTERKDRSAYRLTAPAESVQALTAGGIDLVALANNHADDGGQTGKKITEETLLTAGITPLSEDKGPVWIRAGEVKCAVYACEDVTHPIPIEEAVQAVSRMSAGGNCVIVSLHWGMEYQTGPYDNQKKMAQRMADAGAWLIWGHHPHVVQPAVWMQGKGQPRRTLVLFSLGNALFDQVVPKDARRSAGVVVLLHSEGIRRVEVYPFEIDPLGGKVKEAGFEEARKTKERLGMVNEN